MSRNIVTINIIGAKNMLMRVTPNILFINHEVIAKKMNM